MNDEVNVPFFISPHFLDSSSSLAPISSTSLISEISNCNSSKNESESTTEANDVLKNGILIQTNKGVELLSLTEALKSGVGGLILSVEDFQNVAAQLLHSQSSAREIANSGENTAPAHSFVRNNSKLESIPDASEHCDKAKVANEDLKLVIFNKDVNFTPTDEHVLKEVLKTSSNSSLFTVSESLERNSDSFIQSDPPTKVKKKGGWPKGKKRKPVLANNNKPPKAPCTGYVYYLSENRKRPEFQTMTFQEVTKALGNEWSNLSQEDRREYLERAEVDKRRYQEELIIYRNSDTYRSQLKRRRVISNKANGSEESDLNTTDDINDEDNEGLYCGACDQWFITLHNKKEHLSGKQHFQVLSETGGSSSLGEMSLDGIDPSITNLQTLATPDVSYVPDAMTNFFHNISEREREIKALQESLRISEVKKKQILKQLQELKQTRISLQKLYSRQKEEGSKLDKVICRLREVPTMFSTEKNLNLNLTLTPHTAITIRTIIN